MKIISILVGSRKLSFTFGYDFLFKFILGEAVTGEWQTFQNCMGKKTSMINILLRPCISPEFETVVDKYLRTRTLTEEKMYTGPAELGERLRESPPPPN